MVDNKKDTKALSTVMATKHQVLITDGLRLPVGETAEVDVTEPRIEQLLADDLLLVIKPDKEPDAVTVVPEPPAGDGTQSDKEPKVS